MRSEGPEAKVELSSVEINILIYLVSDTHSRGSANLSLTPIKYLLESNFPHTAFTLLSESSLPSTSLFQHFHPSYPANPSLRNNRANGNTPKVASLNHSAFGRPGAKLERGELVRKLWKGLRWEEVERHVAPNGVSMCLMPSQSAHEGRSHTRQHVRTHSISSSRTVVQHRILHLRATRPMRAIRLSVYHRLPQGALKPFRLPWNPLPGHLGLLSQQRSHRRKVNERLAIAQPNHRHELDRQDDLPLRSRKRRSELG